MNSSRCSRFPDNSEGLIDADDIRFAIQALWDRAAEVVGEVIGYAWVTSPAPPTGRLAGPWAVGPGVLQMSETADDGGTVSFAVLDAVPGVQIRVVTSGGTSLMRATVTGASVDQGNYRDVPVDVTSVTGPAPTNSAKVSLAMTAVLP